MQGGSIEQVQTDSTSAVSQLIDKQDVAGVTRSSVRDSNQFVELTRRVHRPPRFSRAGGSPSTARALRYAGNFHGRRPLDNNDQGQGGSSSTNAAGAPGADPTPPFPPTPSRSTASSPAFHRRSMAAPLASPRTPCCKFRHHQHGHGSAFEYNRIQALAPGDSWFNSSVTPRRSARSPRSQPVRRLYRGARSTRTAPLLLSPLAEFQRQSYRKAHRQYTSITQDFYNFVKSGSTIEKYMEGTALSRIQGIYHGSRTTGGQIDGQGFCPEDGLGTTCPGSFSLMLRPLGPTFNALYAQLERLASSPSLPSTRLNIPTDLLLIGDTEYLPVNIYATGNVIRLGRFQSEPWLLSSWTHKLTEQRPVILLVLLLIFIMTPPTSVGGGEGFPGPARVRT